MKISTLIGSSVSELLAREPQRLGVRLCPITLTALELSSAIAEIRRVLGAHVFVVGSSPGLKFQALERTLLAPDHRAAEQATEWRNKVDVSAGQHLIYVSVEEHPKASGLRDCLVALRESDLRAAFREWCDRSESGMPPGFADALRDAGLTDHVRVAALCELASTVQKAADRAAKWDALGKNLPLIGLAADQRLSKKDAAERLSANAKIVRALETGEARSRARKGPLGEIELQLHRALAMATPQTRAKALGSVDLGAVTTGQLTPSKPKLSKAAAAAKASAAKLLSKKPPPKATRREPPTQLPTAETSANTERSISDSGPTQSVGVVSGAAASGGEPSRLAIPRLPGALSSLLGMLLREEGHPVEVVVRVGDRSALLNIPKTAKTDVRRTDHVARALPDLFLAWIAARRAFIVAATESRPGNDGAALLTFAMGRLVEAPTVRDALQRHIEATTRLYEAAVDADAPTMRAVLALDTCAVRDGEGVAVRLIGPTHLMTIGQFEARAQAISGLSESVRLRVARALDLAPPAPAQFLEDLGDLPISRPEAGLLVFERAPDAAPEATLVKAGEVLLGRYLDLAPHALLGARVVIHARRDAGAIIEGLARAAVSRSEVPLRRLEVLCSQPPSLVRQGTAERLLAAGFLQLGPIPPVDSVISPHISIRIPVHTRGGEGEEPAPPSRASFSAPTSPARTTFEVRDGRLRVRTSISGIKELEVFEALHAAASGRTAQKAFIRDTVGVSLRSERDEGAANESTWYALIARSIGRRAPLKSFLLIHERIDDVVSCAVVTRDVRPAVRAIQEGLRKVGLREERPRSLQLLASKLADATRSGLVSLRHSGEQLIAGGLLATEIARRAPGTVIAPLEGAAYEALVGEVHDDRGVALLGVTAETGSLVFFVGYATLDPETDVDLSKANIGGTLGRRLAHAVATIHAALTEDGPAAAAAREALSWLLWPALAVDGSSEGRVAAALAAWKGDPHAIEVICMLPPALTLPRGKSPRIGKTPVSVLPIDVDLLNRLVLAHA